MYAISGLSVHVLQNGIKSFYFIRGNTCEKEKREVAERLGELSFY